MPTPPKEKPPQKSPKDAEILKLIPTITEDVKKETPQKKASKVPTLFLISKEARKPNKIRGDYQEGIFLDLRSPSHPVFFKAYIEEDAASSSSEESLSPHK